MYTFRSAVRLTPQPPLRKGEGEPLPCSSQRLTGRDRTTGPRLYAPPTKADESEKSDRIRGSDSSLQHGHELPHQRLLLQQVLVALLGQGQLMLEILRLQHGREVSGVGRGSRRGRRGG